MADAVEKIVSPVQQSPLYIFTTISVVPVETVANYSIIVPSPPLETAVVPHSITAPTADENIDTYSVHWVQ